MVDPFKRIQGHLGTALCKLSLFDASGERPLPSRDMSRCLADLQRVAEELNHAFDALKRERQRQAGAAQAADAVMRRAQQLFAQSPSACLVLRRDGAAIAEANEAASRLLNVSPRHLIGKTFTHFLQRDRDVFLRQLQQGRDAPAEYWPVTLRPRERALVRVRVNVIADDELTAAIALAPAVADDGALEAAS